ncbi:hypothetical protein GGS26DRAFT_588220 [Hypomontagnella submonticulosa]|nr:hypothetical protein GGS26DRAFT_588220 [Hypomontagnella submonticulosa]
MQFTTLLAAAAALAFGANANVIPRDGARYAQFRLFDANGCHDQNQGFITVDQSDANSCQALPASAGQVKSINLESLTDAANGCTFYVYTNNICTSGQQALNVQTCMNVPPPNANWASWRLTCPSA